MTIDVVVAQMRERFTKSQGASVSITADEWNAMAQAIYLRDALESLLADEPGADVKAITVVELAGRRQ